MGMCIQVQPLHPKPWGEQATFRKVLKKSEPFIITEDMNNEFEADL